MTFQNRAAKTVYALSFAGLAAVAPLAQAASALLIFDENVPDQEFIEQRTQVDAHRLVVSRGESGWAQIAAYLDDHPNTNEIHLFAHGSDGSIELAGYQTNSRKLSAEERSLLRTLGEKAAPGADSDADGLLDGVEDANMNGSTDSPLIGAICIRTVNTAQPSRLRHRSGPSRLGVPVCSQDWQRKPPGGSSVWPSQNLLQGAFFNHGILVTARKPRRIVVHALGRELWH